MSVSVFPLRIYYEDTDVSGVVYHANYLRYFERARTEWLRALGLGQDQLMRELGVAFTVAGLEIDYRLPARLDDLLEVHTEVPVIKRASMVFEQRLLRSGGGGPSLAQARVRVACVDSDRFRPMALPEALRSAVQGGMQAKNI
ncbi:tol-pal system-associated acyl-CoA thioesterase [Solimonas terrae]|uniref:Tol-pal system-associated acyl-CoA thioesterase n=1 Tax=Solimonas terrae TaxID=1396819 RepID=A0A6M2BPJ5_9GAMM|nr:tol-pal system-associated acyl-CoA thioesterase [Solimonas terrae]NGY04230.1 tol-pal system-associated acyl-CoA thioesterase [Solimonas terrae]